MAATQLSDSDASLYRLYAVGLLGYEEALQRAESVFHLRRAMLEFDQNASVQKPSPPQASSAGRPSA